MNDVTTKSDDLGFGEAARRQFEFLTSELEFELAGAKNRWLRYDSDDLFVEIYLGRLSYEIGVDLGRRGRSGGSEQKFSLASFVEVLLPEEDPADSLKVATTPEQVDRFLGPLARSLKTILIELRNSDDAFDRVVQGNAEGWQRYLDGMSGSRRREAAEIAWRARDLTQVVQEYEAFEREVVTFPLLPSELARLAYARKHLPAP